MHLGQGGWSAETEKEVPETGSDGPQPRQIDSPAIDGAAGVNHLSLPASVCWT